MNDLLYKEVDHLVAELIIAGGNKLEYIQLAILGYHQQGEKDFYRAFMIFFDEIESLLKGNPNPEVSKKRIKKGKRLIHSTNEWIRNELIKIYSRYKENSNPDLELIINKGQSLKHFYERLNSRDLRTHFAYLSHMREEIIPIIVSHYKLDQ